MIEKLEFESFPIGRSSIASLAHVLPKRTSRKLFSHQGVLKRGMATQNIISELQALDFENESPLEPRLLSHLDQEVLALSLRHLHETLLERDTQDLDPAIEHIASLLELLEDQGRLVVLEQSS